MSAIAQRSSRRPCPDPIAGPARLALLGTGGVGRAFVHRYLCLLADGAALPRLAFIGNSRGSIGCEDNALRAFDAVAGLPPSLRCPATHDCGLVAGDILVDATASDAIAACHARWLARGIHVVTANKLGAGTALRRATAIERAQAGSGSLYGDSATVGAGLPVLRSLRALLAGGDRVHAVAGVLSGSLAWLFRNFDGSQPFSALLRQARAGGYTEPDPRIDLSGEDVRRKLLILARALGLPLESRHVCVESLVPPGLAAITADAVDAHWPSLDAAMDARLRHARRDGMQLRFAAHLEVADDGTCQAAVGLRDLPVGHPLCGGEGTDNCVAIRSCRYRHQSLLIQGPGAGVEVTAAALLDDVARIALFPVQSTLERIPAIAAR